MENISKETKVLRKVSENEYPVISFRYSKDYIHQKRDILFNRIRRAEIYIHIQGDSTVFIGEQMYKIRPGDVLIYNKDEVHFSTVSPDTTLERFVVLFLPEHFDFMDDLHGNLFDFYYERNSYENNLIQLDDTKRKQLLDLLYSTIRHLGDDSFESRLYIFQCTLQLFQMINEAYLAPGSAKQFSVVPKIVNEAIHYIDRNFGKELDLDLLATKINISKSYLSASFKKHLGISPYEYLLSVRLENAKRMLIYGESIKNTCFECGFNDYSHFIQFFKQRTGHTPSKYKKSHKII